jgi:nucleoid-associated protein YgaU
VAGDKVTVKGGDMSEEEREKIILAVGNVEGVAEVEDEDDAVKPTFHTVEKGDTLWAISAKTLGNGAHYEKIFEANKPMLTHPDKIYPGQVLRIPAA